MNTLEEMAARQSVSLENVYALKRAGLTVGLAEKMELMGVTLQDLWGLHARYGSSTMSLLIDLCSVMKK